MEFKYIEDDGTDKEKIIHEEKTICNKPVTNQIFRRSIGILKNGDCKGYEEYKHSCVCRDFYSTAFDITCIFMIQCVIFLCTLLSDLIDVVLRGGTILKKLVEQVLVCRK